MNRPALVSVVAKLTRLLLVLVMSLVLLLQLVLAPSGIVSAEPIKINKCNLNDVKTTIPYYKTCDTTPCSTSSVSLVGSDDAQKAFNYFVSQGLAPYQSAGIIGNMQAESGVQPQRLQSTPSGVQTPAESIPANKLTSGNVGWGLVQWTPPSKMIVPTQQAGKDPNDISVQLEFLWAQLTTGTEKGAGDALKATANVDDAAVSFLTKYERPADPAGSQAIRITFAEQILKQYGNGAPAGTQTSSDGSSNSSSACSKAAPSSSSGYKNPLRDVKGLVGERMDQGVDFAGDGPVYALGNGTVVHVNKNSEWPGGNWTSYKLKDGPAANFLIFVAEDCNVAVSEGQEVTTDTVLCNMYRGPSGIEMGWAEAGTSERALAHGEYSEGLATSYGQNFSQLLHSLGAPAGTVDKGLSPTPLPPNWPTWGGQ